MKKILLYILCILSAIAFQESKAQQTETKIGPIIVCPLNPENQFSRLGIAQSQQLTTNRLAGGSAVTTTFIVNYTGNPPNELRAAFQFALDIWATEIISNVPIVIDVDFLEFNGSTLASAGPYISRDFLNAPLPGTWYPIALANSLANQDLGPTIPDIIVTIGNRSDWYFGTDGNTPAGQYDFVSVVLHEIGHGLGMAAFREPDGTFNNNGFPLIYSRFIEDVNGTDLISMGDASPEAAALYISNNAYVNGTNSVAALNGVRPKLYAPSNFTPGSTIAHWDEFSYPAGDPNSLMTPAIGASESNFDIGDITRGHFKDMGWLLPVGNGVPTDFTNAFITTWQTTAANESIIIPTFPGETYNYSVDWGDGTIENNLSGDAVHNFASAGEHTIKITGLFPRIYFNNAGDKEKIRSIEQWGNIEWASMNHAFWGCSNLVENATDAPNLSIVTNLDRMFMACTSFNQDISNWVVPNTVTSLISTFQDATAFNQDISNWDVSNVTNMNATFLDATSFNQDLTNWDVGNVDNLIATFSGATSFNGDVSNWDVSSALYMNFTFSGCEIFNQDITGWDVSSVTAMAEMFSNARAFNQDISNWDVSSVATMGNMFAFATSFNQNIGNWDVGNVTYMRGMFTGATIFNQDIGGWDVSKVTNMGFMFSGTNAFNQDISTWNVSNVEWFNGTFALTRDFNQDISNWSTGSATTYERMFFQAQSFDNNLGNWNISNVTNMLQMFTNSALSTENYDATLMGWSTLNTGETQIPQNITFDGGNSQFCLSETARQSLIDDFGWTITDGGIDQSCPSLIDFTDAFITTWAVNSPNQAIVIPTIGSETYDYSVDWGDGTIETGLTGNAGHLFDAAGTYTVKITGQFNRIRFASLIPQAPRNLIKTVEQWGNIEWTSMEGAFQGCIDLDVRATDVPNLSNVTDLGSMFQLCKSLEGNVTFNDWDVSNVIYMDAMFSGATLFNQNIANWQVGSVIGMSSMFSSAVTFNQPLASWDVSKVRGMRSMFAGASSFNQNINSWDLGVNPGTEAMFLDAIAFNQPLDNWNVSQVISMPRMFKGATSFNQPLDSWVVSNVQNMTEMFEGAISFDQNIGSWDVGSLQPEYDLDPFGFPDGPDIASASNMFRNAGLSSENYDALLIGWSTLDTGETQVPNGISLNAGNSRFCLGEGVRQDLINNFGWIITDGGKFCPEVEVSLENDGSLSIVDTSADPADDNFTITTDGTNFILSNSLPILISGNGVVAIDDFTVQIPLSSITNGLTLEGGTGTNTLNLDTSLSLLGITNGLTLSNLNVQLSGSGALNVNALTVTSGSFDTNGLITNVTTEANFNTNATLSGTGVINGVLNMNPGSNLTPGTSPGILNTGDLVLDNSNNNFEVDGPTPGTEHDQIVVTGTVTIAAGTTLNLLNGYANGDTDEIFLIDNDGTDAISGTFAGFTEGNQVVFGDFTGTISYVGGDGNDLVLMGVPPCTLAITDQPQDVTLCQDETTLEFTVVASGTGILNYNWQALGNGLTEWTDVADQNGTATLSLNSPVQMESSGLQYRVVITDDQGTVDPSDDCNIISNAAILTVNPLPLPLISGPNSYVEGSGGVTLDAGPDFVDYLWSTGETTQTIIVVEGNYSVEVVNDNGCTGSSEAFTVSKIDSDLLITEIMYNPNGTDGVWEWIEIYNKGLQPIDLAGYVLDDNQGSSIASANIVSGIIPPQGSVILYDADLTQDQFKDAWGDVNLIPVTDFPPLGNNGGDTIGIWSSYLNYDGDNQTQLNVVEQVDYTNELPWPSDDGLASIYLTDLSADNQQGGNWALSTVDVATPLFTAYTSIGVHGNSGADIGSPGTPEEVDVEAPIITCSPNVTMSNDIGLCEASFPIIPATATDNVTLPENITIDFVRSDGALLTLTDPFQVGETIITWTATDEEGNTSESCEQIITVTDDELPVVTVQDITIELEANGEFVITSANFISDNVIVTQSDNCGLNGIVNFAGSTTFTCSDVGQVVTRSVGVNDINGNSSLLVSFNITVLDPLEVCKDVTPPVITCPADVTIAFGESTDPSETGTATATDDIGIDGITFVDTTVDQVITRTWTVTDTSGNNASCNQIITIESENDTTPPVAVCKDFTLVLDEFGLGSINVSDVDGGSTDNVALASISISPSSFNELNIGENQVTVTVTDTSGNSSSCVSTVTVEAAPDTISPEAICQDYTLVLDASGFGTISAEDVDGGSTDNVGITSMSVSPSSFDESNIGTNQVILTVTDAAGNEDECTATVTVEAAPIVACANNLPNEDPNMVLPSGTRALGVDSVLGISTDTNGSPCALEVSNVDSGQPWGAYRISIRLADYGIEAGDEMFIGVDGKSLTGTARVEINRNNSANSALGFRTFGSSWSRYETTFTVPSGVTTLDLWFFSNYAQSTPGVALYDNLVVRNLSATGTNLEPLANAGDDVIVVDSDDNGSESIVLNGANSVDVDGSIVSYVWSENGFDIATGISPTVDFDLGIHVVTLTVTDNLGAIDMDTVEVTVNGPGTVSCPDNLVNEDPSIVLRPGTVGAGVDSVTGTSTDTNGSPCAVAVGNTDEGQPWGTYRISIPLVDYNINAGDELFIGVDGKSLTGTARVEINRNNAPNTALGSSTFGSNWSRYETTFTVPVGITTIDLWFFSNYAQSTPGVALYNNFVVTNLSDTGTNLLPIANAGNDITVVDSDDNGSESVVLNANNSVDLDGSIVSYVWSENGLEIATGETATLEFGVGVHDVTLMVTDDLGATDTDMVSITVTNPTTVACTDDLVNEDPFMLLPSGTFGAGVDSATGTTSDTNGSLCAIQVNNFDTGQPWGSYRIAIRLADYGISVGDEIFIGVDGKSLTGTARVEINRNNAPNTALGSRTFDSTWSRYETTFTVPGGITTLDLWFFSNYAQQTAGSAVYDNLTVSKVNGTLTNRSVEEAKPQNNLALYPNPASFETTISFDLPTTVGTIQVFDVTGRLVRTIKGGLIDKNGTPVNIQEMPTGTYFVKTIDTFGREYQQQMLIKRQ